MGAEVHPAAVLVETFGEAIDVWTSVNGEWSEKQKLHAQVIQRMGSFSVVESWLKRGRRSPEMLEPTMLGVMWNLKLLSKRHDSLGFDVQNVVNLAGQGYTVEEVVSDFPLSLRVLKHINHGESMVTIAGRPHPLPVELQMDYMLRSGKDTLTKDYEKALVALAGREEADEHVMFMMCQLHYGSVKAALASRQVLPVEIALELYNQGSILVKTVLASRAVNSPHIWEKLAEDPAWEIRQALLLNQKAPEEYRVYAGLLETD